MLPLLLSEPLKERSIAAYTHAVDAAATLVLAVVMLEAPVVGAGRSRCLVRPTARTGSSHVCWYSACVRGPIEHLCTSLTSKVRTRDSLSVVSRSGYCCFCSVAMRLIAAAICTAGMRQRYPVIAHTAADDTSCTISMCTVWMVVLYDIDVRVMSVRSFIFIPGTCRRRENKIK